MHPPERWERTPREGGGEDANDDPLRRTAVTAVIAALAVFVGVGLGQPTSSHGGTPSDVYIQTASEDDGVACGDVTPDSVAVMPQEFTVEVRSQVLAYFTHEWTGLGRFERGVLNLMLDGSIAGGQYSFVRERVKTSPTRTVMWSFPDVAPGAHSVGVWAAVDFEKPSTGEPWASLANCALAVLVIPVS